MRFLPPTLKKKLWRADPVARPIIKAIVTEAEDQKNVAEDWQAADTWPVTGITLRNDGALELTPDSYSARITNTTSDGYHTDLDRTSPFTAAMVEWKGTDPVDMEIYRIIAYLHPKVTAAAKTVDQWGCQVFVLHREYVVGGTTRIELRPISEVLYVEATGTTAAEFTFDFTNQLVRPKVKEWSVNPGDTYTYPTCLVMIYAVQSDGSAADNVGWGRDSASASVTTASNVLTGKVLTQVDTREGLGVFTVAAADGAPYITMQAASFAGAATVEFTTTGGGDNRFDLGAAPTKTVEFVVEANEFSDSSITLEIRNDADSAWVTAVDGDTTDDLSGVGANQYYKHQVTLTPDSASLVSPILRLIGVRSLSSVDLTDIARVETVRESMDPLTMKAEIPEATITAIRDGVLDFNDAVTALLSDYAQGDILFRVWIGDPDADRTEWVHRDDFLLDGYEYSGGQIRLTCLSVMELLRQTLPVYDTAANTRDALVYDNTQTFKDVYDDLIDGQVGLQARYRGPGVADDTTTIRERIIQDSDAKDELEAIAILDGGVLISSQGKVKYQKIFQEKAIVAAFESEEIEPLSVSPGFENRLAEFFIRYDWYEPESRFLYERRAFHTNALANLGTARINPPERLAEIPSRYIKTSTVADAVGDRVIDTLGAGMITLSFRSTYAHPELEIGDAIAVKTDKFIAQDPNTAAAVKGNLWVLGVVIGIGGILGRNITCWVRDYSDIIAANEASTITVGFVRYRATVYYSGGQSMGTSATVTLDWDTEDEDVGAMHDPSTNTERLTVPSGGDGLYEVKVRVHYSSFTLNPTKTISTYLEVNGSPIGVAMLKDNAYVPATDSFEITHVLQLQGGDYVEVSYAVSGSAPASGDFIYDEETKFSLTRLSGGDTSTPSREITVPSRRRFW